MTPIVKMRKLRPRHVVGLGSESGTLELPPARVGHSRVGAAAPRGGQALALDHVDAQLSCIRLVAQREVHGAAHLHSARLRLPGQAHLAAAQLRAWQWGRVGREVRVGCRLTLEAWGAKRGDEVKGTGR